MFFGTNSLFLLKTGLAATLIAPICLPSLVTTASLVYFQNLFAMLARQTVRQQPLVPQALKIIVAADDANGIGRGGTIPWRLKGDMEYFRRITTETQQPNHQNAVIMGRKTWESIPARFRPLPGRVNVVLSSSPLPNGPTNWAHMVEKSLPEALRRLGGLDVLESVFVIGGQRAYQEALESGLCDRVYLTRVSGDFQADVHFPALPPGFRLRPAAPGDGPHQEGGVTYRYEVYEKDLSKTRPSKEQAAEAFV